VIAADIRLYDAGRVYIFLYGIIEHVVLVKHLNKMRMCFFAIKISTPPKIGTMARSKSAIGTLMVSVMIHDRTIMIGALASRRMVNIYAICTLVISVVSLVTRLGVEKWSIFPKEKSWIL